MMGVQLLTLILIARIGHGSKDLFFHGLFIFKIVGWKYFSKSWGGYITAIWEGPGVFDRLRKVTSRINATSPRRDPLTWECIPA